MSKLTPSGQSMAALFSPEGEKLRKSQAEKAQGKAQATSTFRIPGASKIGEGDKTQDSLGNPNSPGYQPLNLKKGEELADGEIPAPEKKGPGLEGYQSKQVGSQFIRLAHGWDKILMAQKKLCDKAKGLFTSLEGPVKYHGQRRSSLLEEKSRGAILDLDVEEEREKTDAAKKEAEKKEAA